MEAGEIGKVIDLLDYKTGEPITMEDTGVYICLLYTSRCV